jgi:hypothetical protein
MHNNAAVLILTKDGGPPRPFVFPPLRYFLRSKEVIKKVIARPNLKFRFEMHQQRHRKGNPDEVNCQRFQSSREMEDLQGPHSLADRKSKSISHLWES